MTETRLEHDLLGEREVPARALYGIHTVRAVENFPVAGRPVHRRLVRAFGAVKLAALETNHGLRPWPDDVFQALADACQEVMDGALDGHFPVDALQGGAGTATNMNANEVIANRALQLLGKAPGDYALISPTGDANRSQSTNDTYPTALRLAAIWGLRDLEKTLVALVEAFQQREKEFASIVKVGRTQLQDAVLTTLGRTMSAFAEAVGRDRWRVYKCEERLRVVNLGGTAIGTGLGAARRYIFAVTPKLREITGIGFARAENLVECTQNADVFVEVSGILSACAANLVKIGQDLRLLSSGPTTGFGELELPAVQVGSSIMPGKINPVIPEATIQAGVAVGANHTAIAQAAGMGNLELNAFLPLVADRLLDSLDLLTHAASMLCERCVDCLRANAEVCGRHVDTATATVTALVDRLGYEAAQGIAVEMKQAGQSAREIAIERGLLTGEEFDRLVTAEAVLQLGSGGDA